MAVNPMQRKARNSFLLGMIITLLITGVIIVLLFLQLKKSKDEMTAELAKRVNVYVLNQNVKSGQILTQDMFTLKQVNKDLIPANATSLSSVTSAWFLQTVDGDTVQRKEDGLYIDKADGLIELTYSNGQYTTSDGDTVSLRTGQQPYSFDVNGETVYLMQTSNTDTDTTKVYEDINTGNAYVLKVNNGSIEKEYLKFNTVPLLAKVNMKANTVITSDYVVQSDAVVTDDVRREEYNMVVLPADLQTDDYVDIRLMMPSGQNFIVVSKKQVEVPVNGDGTYVSDTIWMQLNESEILSMSSAIVEAYGIQGAKLYAVKYVEPGTQTAAIQTYVPNADVLAEIRLNPNIVEKAKSELNERYSAASSLRNDYIQSEINNNSAYDSNIQTGVTNGITNSQTTRKQYLDSLGN